MTQRFSSKVRHFVANRAFFKCEYCLVPERFLATIFHIDHIRSLKHEGSSDPDNLAYTCPHCNQNKGSDIATFIDENNEQTIRFFNPRKDTWTEHFELNEGQILGKSMIGQATVKVLDMNQIERVILRKALFEIGQY
jgi:hypothetical protein